MFNCLIIQAKSLTIIGPQAPSAASHVASICDAKEIPYIDTFMDLEGKTSTVNLYPSQETLSQLLIDVIDKYKWQDFVVIYEAPSYVQRIARLLEDRSQKAGKVIVQPVEVGTNFRFILQKLIDMGDRSQNILIESSIDHLSEILEQVKSIFHQN